MQDVSGGSPIDAIGDVATSVADVTVSVGKAAVQPLGSAGGAVTGALRWQNAPAAAPSSSARYVLEAEPSPPYELKRYASA